ncbi:MAG: pilus assembly protein PilM [Desulfobacteraceae bacterium]
MFGYNHHRHPMGIDIHSQGVCALQLHKTRAGMTIGAARQVPLDLPCTGTPEEIDALGPCLKRLRRRLPHRAGPAVVSLPPEYMATFPVTFEVEPHQALESALVEACRKHLSMPLSEAVIDYMHLHQSGENGRRQHQASVVAAPRSRIAQIVGVFHKSGWRVGVIDTSLSALVRLQAISHSLTDTPSILVHIGQETILLAVVSQKEIIAHRHLNWGMGRLRRRMANSMHLAPDAPSILNLLREYGLAHHFHKTSASSHGRPEQPVDGLDRSAPRIVFQILVPYLEDLLLEMYQMIGYSRSQRPEIQFEQICLYGMANDIKDLAAYLEQRLRITTHSVDPFERLGLPEDDPSMGPEARSGYLFALGLSLRGAP